MWYSETLTAKIKDYADKMPNKAAICVGKKAVTYRELQDRIEQVVGNLTQLGIKQGDCVLLSAAMKWEYIAAYMAVKELRAIAVPVLKTASVQEVQYIADITETKLFLSDSPKYKEIEITKPFKALFGKTPIYSNKNDGIIPDEEITEILFTSGTTGVPKGVMLSQAGIAASIHNTSMGMNMQTEDVLLIPLPLNHSFGLRVLRSALFNGETIVLQNGFSFAAEVKANIEQWECSCMVAVASGFKMLMEQMGDSYKTILGGMKYIEFSAGAVPVPMRKKLVGDLPNVILYNTWGSTETGGGMFLNFSQKEDKIQSAGTAINDIELGIIDEAGVIHKGTWRELGRLAIRSKARMLGYYKNKQLTNETLQGEWLYTNDAATMDEDGYVYLSGRIDDMISVGGEKIAPGTIERIALSVAGVQECVCLGVEDKKGPLGQVPVIFVVKNQYFNEKELLEEIRTQGNGYMIPQQIISIPEIPKNYMGKTDRKALYAMYEKGEFGFSERQSEDFADRVMNLMLTRRSIRNFTDAPISRDILEKLVKVGSMAPSGHNMQTWRFTVVQNRDIIQKLKDTAKVVAQKKKTLYYGFLNPTAIIIISNDRRNPDAIQDSSASIENILLMAHAFGIGACWINALLKISDEPEIREILDAFGIPKTHIVHGIIGLGYPANEVKMPAKKDNTFRFID